MPVYSIAASVSSSGQIFGGELGALQALLFDSLSFDPFALLDESADSVFEIAGSAIVCPWDTALSSVALWDIFIAFSHVRQKATALCKSREPYRLFWLENCTPDQNRAAIETGLTARHYAKGCRLDFQVAFTLKHLPIPACDPLMPLLSSFSIKSKEQSPQENQAHLTRQIKGHSQKYQRFCRSIR